MVLGALRFQRCFSLGPLQSTRTWRTAEGFNLAEALLSNGLCKAFELFRFWCMSWLRLLISQETQKHSGTEGNSGDDFAVSPTAPRN